MTETHEIYIGDKIQRALQLIGEEPNEFELRGRHISKVEHSVEYNSGNYLKVTVYE